MGGVIVGVDVHGPLQQGLPPVPRAGLEQHPSQSTQAPRMLGSLLQCRLQRLAGLFPPAGPHQGIGQDHPEMGIGRIQGHELLQGRQRLAGPLGLQQRQTPVVGTERLDFRGGSGSQEPLDSVCQGGDGFPVLPGGVGFNEAA